MSVIGVMKGGVLVPEQPLPFAEGTRLRLRIEPAAEEYDGEGLARDLLGLIGMGDGLPEDLARNHDHYIHGTEKRRKSGSLIPTSS